MDIPGKNQLHGGFSGFWDKYWTVENVSNTSATLSLESPDGDQHFPSAVKVSVTFSVFVSVKQSNATHPNQGINQNANGKVASLDISYTYHNIGTSTTPVNLTNHAFFNLNGGDHHESTILNDGTILNDHRLTLEADHYLAVDEMLIPTGELVSVVDAKKSGETREHDAKGDNIFNFTDADVDGTGRNLPVKLVGSEILVGTDTVHPQIERCNGGYDHTFVIRDATTNIVLNDTEIGNTNTVNDTEINTNIMNNADIISTNTMNTSLNRLRKAATVTSSTSKIGLTCYTTEPGVQVYTGNFFAGKEDEDRGKKGQKYKKHSAICLETQKFPNSVNMWRDSGIFLNAGEIGASKTLYSFWRF